MCTLSLEIIKFVANFQRQIRGGYWLYQVGYGSAKTTDF